jgi:predicted esterase
MSDAGPHQGQPVLAAGVPLEQASAAMILVHGRGASAASILSLAGEFPHAEMAYLAPQAAHNTWYPQSFLAPIAQNEPGISSGIAVLAALVAHITEAGIPTNRIVIGGFSQGACLASEFAARHPARYGGVFAFSGGVIGPPGTARNYAGSLEDTLVFVGCSDSDPHIPLVRVQETSAVLRELGGDVTERIYPGMGHTINADEIAHVQRMLQTL